MEKQDNFYNKLMLLIVAFIITFISSLLVGISIGEDSKQIEIRNRAKKINKECYTNTDLEYIIFNEKQL